MLLPVFMVIGAEIEICDRELFPPTCEILLVSIGKIFPASFFPSPKPLTTFPIVDEVFLFDDYPLDIRELVI
jgi:hypothetical protein